ncbi:MAG: HlyD family efflux transporter periplasmic adaptor subunit [Bacteroidia bacterium]|nr:HlyD family efflux transporter periplasmic adaptor subunit [Bacteroidia bacterium]
MNSTTGTAKILPVAILLSLFTIAGCNRGGASDEDDDDSGTSTSINAKVEVNVVNPRIGSLSEYRILNATSVFLLNDIVRAPIAGYINTVYVTTGQEVKPGDKLFAILTKEASVLVADTLFPSRGVITVKATQAGIIKEVDRQQGDYMQDGDQFCTIADKSSLVFMLDVPFEIHNFVVKGHPYTISLPDGETVKAQIASQIPQMDRAVQMERFILRPSASLDIPEGLIATVYIPTITGSNATILPKNAVLSDETQTDFWVMKAVHDSLAVKVPVIKGIETRDSVEIKSPAFSDNDKILVTGNYGVPDTVKIKIMKQ